MKIHQLREEHKNLHQSEVILDVRGRDEFKEAHIPGAINIPHDEVANHVNELKKYLVVHIHCKSGKRAQKAAEVLTEAGLSNIHCIDDSGIQQWIEQGYPTE